jgi:hypothetical protein
MLAGFTSASPRLPSSFATLSASLHQPQIIHLLSHITNNTNKTQKPWTDQLHLLETHPHSFLRKLHPLRKSLAESYVPCPSYLHPTDSPQEENRLKAKALRERSLAARAAAEASTTSRTPSGFIATSDSARKRAHASISTTVPATSRDARQTDNGIQPARKFKKYVDHDFSKMTDTKGGFLTAEDDPFNKVLHAPVKEDEKPAHMTLKEWERHQVLKGLRSRKEGPFEPGIMLGEEGSQKCRECGGLEVDWQWVDVFKTSVCSRCKEKFPERYSLLTKTEAKDDYLLTDREFISGLEMGMRC